MSFKFLTMQWNKIIFSEKTVTRWRQKQRQRQRQEKRVKKIQCVLYFRKADDARISNMKFSELFPKFSQIFHETFPIFFEILRIIRDIFEIALKSSQFIWWIFENSSNFPESSQILSILKKLKIKIRVSRCRASKGRNSKIENQKVSDATYISELKHLSPVHVYIHNYTFRRHMGVAVVLCHIYFLVLF